MTDLFHIKLNYYLMMKNIKSTFRQSYHIISDLHLEHQQKITSLLQFVNTHKQIGRNGYNLNDKKNLNRILILAGDIGYPTENNYWLFLEDCSKKYKHVICIPGNHEYYDGEYNNIDQINEIIEKKSKEIMNRTKNFHYLNNSTVTIDGITYIGTTLWSNLDTSKKREIVRGLNDFNYIKMKLCKNFTFDDYIDFHQRDLNWLTTEINKNINENNNNFVVITHHLPSFQLVHSKYRESSINSAFSTNLDNIINGKLWISGHTHTPMTKTINNVPVIVNPFGYTEECKFAGIKEISVEFDL